MKILITGSAGGIGLDVALTLAQKKHLVYITTHTNQQALLLKERLNNLNLNIICFKLDITDNKDLEYVNQLDIDCLICHAGIGVGGSLVDLPITKIRENFETNYFGTFSLIKTALPKMLKKDNAKIIVTSSIAGIIPIPFLGSYCSTKAAISIMVKTLRQELKLIKTSLQIGLIEPGIYNTGFNDVMLDNKELFFDDSPYFVLNKRKISTIEKKLFHFLGKDSNRSIVKKFIKAVETDKLRKVYRAPLLQRIGVKLYLILFG